jgi:hypothetical protein
MKKMKKDFYTHRKIINLCDRTKQLKDMRDSNEHATSRTSAIQCLEVLISRNVLDKSPNLQWTLSVYSLENQPVRKCTAVENSDIFHFMVFDWKRTIKKLLDDHQVDYSIIQYFSPGSVYSDSLSSGFDTLAQETDYLKAAAALHEAGASDTNPRFSKVTVPKTVDLIHEQENH